MSRLSHLSLSFRRTRRAYASTLAAIAIVIVVVFAQPVVAIAAQTGIKISRTVEIDEVGDARVKLEIKAPTNEYTTFKSETPNVAVLLRQLGAGRNWSELSDVEGRFDDNTSTIVIHYTEHGMARTTSSSTWMVPFDGGEAMDLITQHGNEAIFTEAANTDLGLTTMVLRIVAPAQSHHIRVEHGPERFVYELESSADAGNDLRIDFECDVKPYLMASLAKSYGNAGFANLWTARSVLKNSGTETLRDYRVRFRIADHSSWSSWKESEMVIPGQTVVDPFFPVLDVEKLAKMTGTRPAMLEVEYEYRNAEGELIHETNSQRLQLLSRNQAVFSSLPQSEIITFHDAFDYVPALLASMVTAEDPVMQQLAGVVSGKAGGVAASANDEDAIKYLEALYNFLSENNIAYQTPPGFLMQGSNGQHIKYGRDVLRNHAGTCVDLAILHASAYEAVGLQPVLVVIPGHCFPAVYLPSGELVAVESTMVGKASFRDAVETGMKELQEARQGIAYFVDIRESRELGLYALDLPETQVNFLTELGYNTERPRNDNVQVVNYEQNTNTNHDNNRRDESNSVAVRLTGKWTFDGNIEGVRLTAIAVLADNGGYAGYVRTINQNGYTEETNSTGTWRLEGNKLILNSDQGTFIRPFKVENGTLWVYFDEIDYTLGFTRVN